MCFISHGVGGGSGPRGPAGQSPLRGSPGRAGRGVRGEAGDGSLEALCQCDLQPSRLQLRANRVAVIMKFKTRSDSSSAGARRDPRSRVREPGRRGLGSRGCGGGPRTWPSHDRARFGFRSCLAVVKHRCFPHHFAAINLIDRCSLEPLPRRNFFRITG